MAYINKYTFEISGNIPEDEMCELDWFECDDAIAPIISLLNKMGWTTEFCCSGHPYQYKSIGYSVEYPDTMTDNTIIPNSIRELTPYEKNYHSDMRYFYAWSSYSEFYIKFSDDVEDDLLKHLLPDDNTTIDNHCIRRCFTEDDTSNEYYHLYRKINGYCETLYYMVVDLFKSGKYNIQRKKYHEEN